MWENKVKTYDVFELRAKNTCYYDIKVLSKVKIKLQKIEKSINKVIVIIDKVEYNIWNSYGLGIAEGSLFDSTKSVAILLEHTDKKRTELYDWKGYKKKCSKEWIKNLKDVVEL